MVVYQDQASCHVRTETNRDIDKQTEIDDAGKYVLSRSVDEGYW